MSPLTIKNIVFGNVSDKGTYLVEGGDVCSITGISGALTKDDCLGHQ